MDKWEEMRKYLVFELNRALEEREGPYAHPSLSTAMLMQENTILKHLRFMEELDRKEKKERKMKSHDKIIQSKKSSRTGQK